MLGLDTRADRYTYGVDPDAGYVSAQKIPDRWVPTTCGYCSVGCGMFIGVKDGRAVSRARQSRPSGEPRHAVPEGPVRAPHHRHGQSRPVSAAAPRTARWSASTGTKRSTTMAARFRDVQARHGAGAVGVISTGQLVTEEFYALGKLCSSESARPTTTATRRCACPRRWRATSARSAATDRRARTRTLERADVILLIGANIAENHPILCRRLRPTPARRSSWSIPASRRPP